MTTMLAGRIRVAHTCLGVVVMLLGQTARAEETPAGARRLTLQECYAFALQRSETLAIHQEQLKETEARFRQAFSGLLPLASFSSSDKRQDGSGGSAFTLREVPERKFTVTQTLFSGFKEFAALSGSRAERREREHARAYAELLLLLDVSDAFYRLAEAEADQDVLASVHQILTERLEQLQQRETLGRSRPTEVVSAEAQRLRVEAEQERVQALEDVARQMLAFLTGVDDPEPAPEAGAAAWRLGDQAGYEARADQRPDVLAAEEAWHVATHEVKIARAGWFPTVSAEGNYYTKRVGSAADVDWDALLKVDVPIFQGGQTRAETLEASSQARQAHLVWLRTRREAVREIQESYTQLRGALEQQAALERARDAAEEHFRLEVEDYQHNLVNHLDVLRVLQELQDARRELLHMQHEVRRGYWRLQAATAQPLDVARLPQNPPQ